MNKILMLVLLTTLGSSFASTNDLINEHDKLELRTIADNELSSNSDFGILRKSVPRELYGIYGVKNDEDEGELLGEIVISSVSFGFISSLFAYNDDDILEIENIDGSKLKDICSNFMGSEIGGALIKGGTGFSVRNLNGVILKSSVTTTGVIQVVFAGIRVKVKCLDMKINPNWNKTVSFESK